MSKKTEKHEPKECKDAGIYFLWKDITDESCKDCAEWIINENLKKGNERQKELTLLINSNGGNVYAGFALIDVIEGSRIPINTVIMGMSASMGLMISMVGKKRYMTTRSQIMSHPYWTCNFGTYHELVNSRESEDNLFKVIVKHYEKYTGLKPGKIRSELLKETDTYMTPEQALKYNLIDEIKEYGV